MWLLLGGVAEVSLWRVQDWAQVQLCWLAFFSQRSSFQVCSKSPFDSLMLCTDRLGMRHFTSMSSLKQVDRTRVLQCMRVGSKASVSLLKRCCTVVCCMMPFC